MLGATQRSRGGSFLVSFRLWLLPGPGLVAANLHSASFSTQPLSVPGSSLLLIGTPVIEFQPHPNPGAVLLENHPIS